MSAAASPLTPCHSVMRSITIIWGGICRSGGAAVRLANGDLFLMNPAVRDSLDGRYFGPLPARAVIGKATPLYTDEAGDGRFIWRAATR